MFSFASFIDLPLVWSGIVALAVFLYVVLDGFDLGVGILFPFLPSDKCRDTTMNSIAPFWDGNETWLIMGGGGLLAVFPKAFALLMPAVYLPIIIMLIALIFRGVAFEFRFKANRSRRIWDISFHAGSLIATFAQGVVLGVYVQGISIEEGQYAGGAFDWLTPFSLTTGLALVFGYALLGATWIVQKSEGETLKWARFTARYLVIMIMFFMGIVSLWVPFFDEEIKQRWFALPNLYFLMPIPVLTAYLAVKLFRALGKDHTYRPFFMTIGIFTLGYLGLAISLYPYIIPRSVTIWEAAAPPESMSLMLVGALFVLPVIVFYVGYCYWVFRGKASHEHGYGDA